ncbi:MAG TPA: hypothetical protein PLR17_04005 [Acetomicrobium flavidum]|uniref:Uncharacterized protein n=1 Tax=Acetomicrobium flavidum TaxID=49896 RepID=A0ABY1JE93_9BACT|nr:hypothetical protein SAMN05444368_1393 [Acetomicrobium flavidum]HOJ82236.1 hypothetical protein [Acetomicrobium flavidum]HOM31141.1 hypothetical protein [Acetomicrobium flavidum]HPP14440.1 hypothetical protein [Acetomicrobium flavidum]
MVQTLVLILSISTVVFIGYAVAGISSFFYGVGRLDLIALGLIGGLSSGACALLLWLKFMLPRSTKTGKD